MQLVLPIESELALLRQLEESLRDAHKEHLRTGDYVRLGIKTQDALMALDRSLMGDKRDSSR